MCFSGNRVRLKTRWSGWSQPRGALYRGSVQMHWQVETRRYPSLTASRSRRWGLCWRRFGGAGGVEGCPEFGGAGVGVGGETHLLFDGVSWRGCQSGPATLPFVLDGNGPGISTVGLEHVEKYALGSCPSVSLGVKNSGVVAGLNHPKEKITVLRVDGVLVCAVRTRKNNRRTGALLPIYLLYILDMSSNLVIAPTPRRSPAHSPMANQPRPSSRSERLLRDTLRKDDTLRTTRARSRSRSVGSDVDPQELDEDDDLIQPSLLFRSRRRTAPLPLPRTPDEHASYIQLLRSPSFSGSSRSKVSDSKKTQCPHEKLEDVSLYVHEAAPHEAVLRTRLEHVLHGGMREVKREKGCETGTSSMESSAGSPLSSLLSLANSRHSHESEQTHLTPPEYDAHKPSTPPPYSPKNSNSQTLCGGPTFSRPVPSTSPATKHREPSKSPPSGRSQPNKSQYHRQRGPYSDPRPSVPLPPTPALPPMPIKHANIVVSPVNTGHPASAYEALIRSQTPALGVQTSSPSPPKLPPRRSFTPNPSYSHMQQLPHAPTRAPVFDPDAASIACKKVPGYVSFASVAGLGAPPDEEDRHSGRRVAFSGKGIRSLPGLGFGNGKWCKRSLASGCGRTQNSISHASMPILWAFEVGGIKSERPFWRSDAVGISLGVPPIRIPRGLHPEITIPASIQIQTKRNISRESDKILVEVPTAAPKGGKIIVSYKPPLGNSQKPG
ncbi:hypothetical protein EDD15DRAFT_2192310 [Pisolithus albus]|nr:hypothetical protein EDD15DRAFT_2192310 [Pisolithus albus]